MDACVTKNRQYLVDHLHCSRVEVSNEASQDNANVVEVESNRDEEGGGDINNEKQNSEFANLSSANLNLERALEEVLDMKVSERDLSHICTPKLQRRLPMTSDTLAQHRHLANKLKHGSSRSANDNAMLKWQILCPELVSDIRAFKSCNATLASSDSVERKVSTRPVSFEDFFVWYGGAGVILPHSSSRQECKVQLTQRGLDGIHLESLKVIEFGSLFFLLSLSLCSNCGMNATKMASVPSEQKTAF